MTTLGLTDLLDCPPAAFLADLWDARPRHVRGATARFDGLFPATALDALLAANALEPDALTLLRDGKRVPRDLYRTDAVIARHRVARDAIDPVRVRELHADGASLLVHGLERKCTGLRALADALGAELDLHTSVNAILSPPGAAARTLGLHYDVCGVLVLQLEGSKVWSLHAPSFPLPLPQHGFSTCGSSTPGPVVDAWSLQPGDALFIPRGHPHVVEPTLAHSLHLAIQLVPRTAYDDLRDDVLAALERAARADVALRRTVPRRPTESPPPARLADLHAPPSFRPSGVPFRYQRRDDGGYACLTVRAGAEAADEAADEAAELPVEAEPMLARMRSSPAPFCAASLGIALPARLQHHVFEALMQLGLLDKCSPGA